MYNLSLSVDDISMVDGDGDGNSNSSNLYPGLLDISIVRALSRLHPALGIAYSVGNIQSNNSGVGTGTNQSYGSNGLDTGGMM